MITIIQQNASLPESVNGEIARGDDFVSKWTSARSLGYAELSIRELGMLVEYIDVIADDVRVLVGLPGAEYSVVWANYAATLPRVTVDDIEAELKQKNDTSAVAGQRVTTTTLERRNALRQKQADQATEDADIGEIE